MSDWATVRTSRDATAAVALTPLRDTAANLAATNPVLAVNRLGIASDTGVLKMGDGVTAWNSLRRYEPISLDLPAAATTTSGLSAVPLTGTDWPGLTLAVTGDGITAVKLHAHAPLSSADTVGSRARIAIQEGASIMGIASSPNAYAVNAILGGLDCWVAGFVPTVGLHTYKVTAYATVSGTAAFTAGAGFPALFEAERA